MLTLYEWVKAKNSKLLEEWDYEMNGSLRPDKVCNSSHLKVWWKCKVCGNSWTACVNKRTIENKKLVFVHRPIIEG